MWSLRKRKLLAMADLNGKRSRKLGPKAGFGKGEAREKSRLDCPQ
jgi:hypothetical protein